MFRGCKSGSQSQRKAQEWKKWLIRLTNQELIRWIFIKTFLLNPLSTSKNTYIHYTIIGSIIRQNESHLFDHHQGHFNNPFIQKGLSNAKVFQVLMTTGLYIFQLICMFRLKITSFLNQELTKVERVRTNGFILLRDKLTIPSIYQMLWF